MKTYMHFRTNIAREKPSTHLGDGTSCPFCDRDTIGREGVIIKQEHPFLLIENKFQTLEEAYQMVLIETESCEGDLSTYEQGHLHSLIRFAITSWLEIENSGQYRSVAFFKNHGIHSGGSIYHPHMQIVGLANVDYREHVSPEHFAGYMIDQSPGIEFNLSSHPLSGFSEFNIVLTDRAKLDKMADYIQMTVKFIMNHMNKKFKSYNIFFYYMEEKIIAKIILRAPTSPYLMGYSIVQIPNHLEEVVARMRSIYF
ncbi:DUF4931 domain-containing protein [Aneurinibacillus terranovensis]|uniref:DUF4931 domain-containing protein n=1 Tax=Aneurinibacillus terranovensis TaxID=278991 RepID=UPI000414EC2B|nr:DUF4931 domain-containing protein [Aneurinibacillus terranovensis]